MKPLMKFCSRWQSSPGDVLDCFSVAVIKNKNNKKKISDQKQLRRRKGLLWLTLPGHSPSLREVRAETEVEMQFLA